MDIVDCKYNFVPHFLECSPNIDITSSNTLLVSTLIIGILYCFGMFTKFCRETKSLLSCGNMMKHSLISIVANFEFGLNN
jgi:hypothetical protein